MTDKSQLHPEKEQLVAFGLGKLEPDKATKIEVHLGECEACCETLLDLKDDTFVGLVRNSPEPKPPSHDADEKVNSGKTEPADEVATDDAISETMLVESGVPRLPACLPTQLENHPRYRIVELIGKGGMGDVYKAEHRLMHRPVALKFINQDLVKNTQAVERFRREVQAAARLTHPNIVTAFDAEQAGDVHFLAMEFVEGTDLETVVRDRGALPVNEACEYIQQAAEGLQHAYEKGMVHRDIKPHNLMLSPDGQVRILDFGLAGFATESSHVDADSVPGDYGGKTPLHLTTMGSVMGTPDYIAPEQARDAHSADIRADIYSLGCTLLFLLTGKVPFEADSVVETLKAHADQESPALRELRNDVPVELADLVSRMMAKAPEDRFQMPDEVTIALASFVAPDNSPEHVPPPRRGFGRWLSSPAVWLSTLLLAGVIYVVTGNGRIEIRSDVDVEVSIMQDGKEVKVLDVESGTEVFWISTGDYRVIPKGETAVSLSRQSLTVSGLGRELLTIEAVDVIAMKEEALVALKPWLSLRDDGQYGKCWENMAAFAHEDISRERFTQSMRNVQQIMGRNIARRIESQQYASSLPRVGGGHFVTFRFEADFENYAKMREQAVVAKGADDKWKVISYFTTLPPSSDRDSSLPDQTRILGDKDKNSDYAQVSNGQPQLVAARVVAIEWLEHFDDGGFARCWNRMRQAKSLSRCSSTLLWNAPESWSEVMRVRIR